MTTRRVTPLVLPAATLGPENALPVFRDPQVDRSVRIHPDYPAAKQVQLGSACGARVLPYGMQDDYSRARTTQTYQSIVLENDALRATFVPALGGRLWSLYDKTAARELLNRNPVFQPANLAIRNAWFSGGIEWNVSQYGHTFGTCDPVTAAAITDSDGSPGLRLSGYERCKQLCWQIDFFLPPASPWLIAHTTVANPNPTDTSMYWWTNIAVDEAADVRVLVPGSSVIYCDLTGKSYDYAMGELPAVPTFDGRDATYSTNAGAASEYFCQLDDVDMPWEAAIRGDGSGFVEASTGLLRYRKMFCWGMHSGGRHWQDFLAPGGTPYLEIQAGLAPSQLHGITMPAGAEWHWTQVFGAIQIDPQVAHHPDWEQAWRGTDAHLRTRVTPAWLDRINTHYTAIAGAEPATVISHGSGWGALEDARRAATGQPPLPACFGFRPDSLTTAQQPWVTLLAAGYLPTMYGDAPAAWMVSADWEALLAAAPRSADDWHAQLHLGVMALERFDSVAATRAWERSLALRPNPWAWRNLAVVARRRDDIEGALHCMAAAWALSQTRELAQEYLELLCALERWSDAAAVYAALPPSAQQHDRLRIVRARIAYERGDDALLEQLLGHEYAVVREGETELTDLWYAWRRRQGHTVPGTPPVHLDFRPINKG